MNYQKIYDCIIAKYKAAIPSGYVEKHHIVPKCLGGDNSKENIVKLPARAHFVAHLLLAKIYGGSLIYAVKRLSFDGNHGNRYYDWIRKLEAKESSRMHTGSKHAKGYKCTPEQIENRKRAGRLGPHCLGYKWTQEQKAKLSLARLGNHNKLGKKESLETCEKKRIAALGKRHSSASKLKMSKIKKEWWDNRKLQQEAA